MKQFDHEQRKPPVRYLIGVDEAGRGSLAGPMFAAAVILRPTHRLEQVDDSKRLSTAQREMLADLIRAEAFAWGVAHVTPREIDGRGLDWANRMVFTRAVRALQASFDVCVKENTLVLVDGIRPAHRCPFPQLTVKGGDRRSLSIAAASILAKTARDRYCLEIMHPRHPEYGFEQHKGYATALHYAALEQHGPSSQHRFSYKLVRISTK